MLRETLKKKYKLEKGQRGYAINSISNKAFHVSIQLLAGKVIQKCRDNEVPTIVIALAENA